jgi:hypothetical protein
LSVRSGSNTALIRIRSSSANQSAIAAILSAWSTPAWNQAGRVGRHARRHRSPVSTAIRSGLPGGICRELVIAGYR